MDPFKPSVMITQVEDIAHLIRTEFNEIESRLKETISEDKFRRIQHVFATGDGDSWHAAMAVKMAFQMYSGVIYEPISAMRFLTYDAEGMPRDFPETNLVIGISASGGSTRVVQSLEKAKAVNKDNLTLGMVGNPESQVAEIADFTFSVEIPDFGPSPGIRSYVASLLGGYALALRLGEVRGYLSASEAQAQRDAILASADVIDTTIQKVKDVARVTAEDMKDNAFFSFVGSGPSYATAYFSSAKLIEAAGVFSTAQDLEEWVHIEHHAYPTDYPIYMIAPPGRSFNRAENLAYLVTMLGHPLIAVTEDQESKVKEHANVLLPIAGSVPEEYSPLVYHIPADYFACYLAQSLNRMPFMQDNDEVRNRINSVTQQIRDSAE